MHNPAHKVPIGSRKFGSIFHPFPIHLHLPATDSLRTKTNESQPNMRIATTLVFPVVNLIVLAAVSAIPGGGGRQLSSPWHFVLGSRKLCSATPFVGGTSKIREADEISPGLIDLSTSSPTETDIIFRLAVLFSYMYSNIDQQHKSSFFEAYFSSKANLEPVQIVAVSSSSSSFPGINTAGSALIHVFADANGNSPPFFDLTDDDGDTMVDTMETSRKMQGKKKKRSVRL